MIPTNNPFREFGNVETFVSKWLAEEDKKPLIKWFDKFEKALKKMGINYAKSKIDPTDAMDMYYDGKKPEEAAKALAEDTQLDEYVKSDGSRRRVSGGDGRRTENRVDAVDEEDQEEGFASDAQRRAAFASGYKAKGKKGKKKDEGYSDPSMLTKKKKKKMEDIEEDIDEDDVPADVRKIAKELDDAIELHSSQSQRLKDAGIVDNEDMPQNVRDIPKELDAAVAKHKSQAERLRKSGISESVELDEMQPHGMFGNPDDLGPVYRMIKSALDKIGIGYRISGQTVKVNPKNVGAAKAALKKTKGFSKSGMSVVKDKKVAFAEESVELTDQEQKLLDFINKNW